ncbi:MAG: ATP-binding cassette domain-containing protein, partial [Coriobacteriales bacterium]|nr:ATP-binding cassette domain-containing protein [Coriobacteriales bacterium]
DMYCLADAETRIRELLEAVELDHRRLDLTRTFSRGMTQRLSIARALLHRPDVLFLDEPYSGLDPHAMDILDSLMAQIRSQHTFVMISHDLAKGLELCTHALILARGRIVLFEPKENIDEERFSRLYRETVGLGVA